MSDEQNSRDSTSGRYRIILGIGIGLIVLGFILPADAASAGPSPVSQKEKQLGLALGFSGAAISLIAYLHGRGGFDLVLQVTAVIAFGFVVGTAGVALLVNGVERERSRAVVPAE